MTNGGKIVMEDQACLLCGSARVAVRQNSLGDVEEGLPGEYTIGQCAECELVFLARRPCGASLPECYGDSYHAVAARRYRGFSGVLYDLRYYFRYRQLQAWFPKGSLRILEIGCGDAKLLLAMEKALGDRAELLGLDYAVAAIALPANSKIKLIQGDIQTAPIEGKFDVILMFDVLEHLADPVGCLTRIRRGLKAGGLLIGQVPNWNSLWRRVFPRCWSGLQVPRHMSFFTPATLRKTLAKGGFDNVRLKPVFDPGDLSVSLCNWLVRRRRWPGKPRGLKIYIPLTLAAAPVVALQNMLGDSGAIFFVAKLPS
ncbi:MAG: class I SAM-dependent methyltransferase [Lentisphaerae bacterium]|nr:class I SAM-dependent methyltransferase [Lentisphaerota bacterium]